MIHRVLFTLSAVTICTVATAQMKQELFQYEKPIATSPVQIQYSWRCAANLDGDRVAVCYGHWQGAGEVRLFDGNTGESLQSYSFDRGVTALKGLPGRKQFATGDSHGNVVIRNFRDGSISHRWKSPMGSIGEIAFSSDGADCYLANTNDQIIRADTKTGKVKLVYKGHNANPCDIMLSPDESMLLTIDMDGVIFVWDAETATVVHQLKHSGRVPGFIGLRTQNASLRSGETAF